MKIEEKIALLRNKPEQSSHIEIDPSICRQCDDKICLKVCPAHLYELDAVSGQVKVEHTGCLECATCWLVCSRGALKWRYPNGSFGVCYRYG